MATEAPSEDRRCCFSCLQQSKNMKFHFFTVREELFLAREKKPVILNERQILEEAKKFQLQSLTLVIFV